MKYIPGLPNNPPTHLVEYFHNKVMIESVKKQLNYVIGCLLNSLQNKSALIEPVRIFMDHMNHEKFNGPITLDYLSKGIDYASYCVATKDLNNIRQGWPKLSDDFSIGMSAAFVLNNESALQQVPEQLRPMIQNSATAFTTELNAALNFSNNGSINMFAPQYPMNGMMPNQGVQQFPANGMQQYMNQPMQVMPQQNMMFQANAMQQQQIMQIIQSNPQLMMMYQQNPQMAMQQAMMMMQQGMLQNPYLQRANTITPQQNFPQAPVTGFINNNNPAFGVVPNNQVGTTRGSSFAGGANIAPQQVQLNQNQGNSNLPPYAQNQGNQTYQPQPTAQQLAPEQQVIGATVRHGNGQPQPVNLTQQSQPINNANTVPQHSMVPTMNTNYSNLAEDVVIEGTASEVIANDEMTYNIQGRRVPKIYSRENEILMVTQDVDGVVVEDIIMEAKVKYEEHESQRILPTRTKAEKRASASNERMNKVLELASTDVSYKSILEKIRADQEAAGEEMVDVDVSRIITELGTNAVRLDMPTYALSKTSILPIIRTILDQNMMPVDTTNRPVLSDVVIGGPLSVSEVLATEIDKLNKTHNLNEYISQLDAISRLDIPNYHWTWIHDEVLKEVNNFIEKYYGLAITIESVLMDLDELIDYVAKNYHNDLSSQMYMGLHTMLTSTVLQVFRHAEWPEIVDDNQIYLGKVYRVVTLPIVTCQVPYNSPGKSGIIDRNTHTQLVALLDKLMKGREDYHSILLITVENDILEVMTTTIDGNYIMYCGNE